MRLSDLRDLRVKTLDGKTLGRVHDVHCERGRVTAVMCGSWSLIERWTGKKHGRRIPWECVVKVDAKHIVVAPASRPRKPPGKPSGARTRQGTRQPSARRSKR